MPDVVLIVLITWSLIWFDRGFLNTVYITDALSSEVDIVWGHASDVGFIYEFMTACDEIVVITSSFCCLSEPVIK